MTVKVLSASAVTVCHTDSLDMPTTTVNNLRPVKSKMGKKKGGKITLLYSRFPQTHHFQNALEPQVLQHFDSVCCSKKHLVHPHCCCFALYFLSPFSSSRGGCNAIMNLNGKLWWENIQRMKNWEAPLAVQKGIEADGRRVTFDNPTGAIQQIY